MTRNNRRQKKRIKTTSSSLKTVTRFSLRYRELMKPKDVEELFATLRKEKKSPIDY